MDGEPMDNPTISWVTTGGTRISGTFHMIRIVSESTYDCWVLPITSITGIVFILHMHWMIVSTH